MRNQRVAVVSAAVSCCVGWTLLFGSSAKDGVGDDKTPGTSAVVETSRLSKPDGQAAHSKREELDQIGQYRKDYKRLVGQVAGELRKIQGIPDGYDHSSDVRLTGASVSGLLREFDSPERISVVEEDLILLAGEIRAAEFSNLLLNRIACVKANVPINARAMLPSNPALAALCQIGEPSCREALKRIPLESDQRRRKNMVRLMQMHLGDTRSRSQLVGLQRNLTDAAQCERIASAIAQIDSDAWPPSPRESNRD